MVGTKELLVKSKLNILIDIGHPAHVHYFRNLANELTIRGHEIFWTVKDIDIAKRLLDQYGFTYVILPQKSDRLIGKILNQIRYDFKLFRFCKVNKIDFIIGFSVSATHVSRLSKVKSIIFDDDDDDVQPIVTKYVTPYSNELLSPESLKGKRIRKDTVFYPGFHELAYLHPNRFTPDEKVLKEINIQKGEPFFILRFNVFKAHHDKGISGLSLAQKLQLVQILKPIGKIFITTERTIEPELEEFQLNVSPEKIHSLLYYSTMFISDSQTMTSEAAVLGVPSLRCNSFAGRISYLEEEEHKYGLTFAFKPEDFNRLIGKLNELISIPDLRSEWQKRRNKMLNDKIDVTAFWVWFIDNYPSSKSLIKNSAEFWDTFK